MLITEDLSNMSRFYQLGDVTQGLLTLSEFDTLLNPNLAIL